ncbi:MAG: CHASE2 domain-containing protein [Magnetococcales bacterium]|nr:CHASE2 domain-containing protein [Magnetococcales bacterium]
MKIPFWRRNWFVGLVLLVVFAVIDQSRLVQSLERSAYDLGMRLSSRAITDRIAVIAIDDQSIANIGRWPWSRRVHAEFLGRLAEGGPKLVASTVLFLEPQLDPGLDHLRRIHFSLQSLLTANASRPPGADEATQTVPEKKGRNGQRGKAEAKGRVETKGDAETVAGLQTLNAMLVQAMDDLNTDRFLASAVKRSGNVLLSMPIEPGRQQGKPDQPLPTYAARFALPPPAERPQGWHQPLKARTAIPPIPILGEEALGIGHINDDLDVDGTVRTTPLVVYYDGVYYPSLALLTAAMSLNIKLNEILLFPNGGLQLANLRLQTNGQFRMNTYFYHRENGEAAFPVDSFYDVLSGKIPASKYRDRIVLIGSTAVGVDPLHSTPVSPAMSSVQILAHGVASILGEDFFVVPEWTRLVKIGGYLGMFLYMALILPYLSGAIAALLTLLLASGMVAAPLYLMVRESLWIQLMGPLTMLVVGYLFLSTRRHMDAERGRDRSSAESAESNRMLGLAFQGQGQLDMAFEKLRKCPVDETMLDVLYNLALDFERKRQFGKAVAVYRYMAGFEPHYRDIHERMQRGTALENTVVLGGRTIGPGKSLLSPDGGVETPMLGRYRVEKELGKGAMGIVYQGRDPQINRVVAIKTMSLTDQFEEGPELIEAKKRFFREAESAGRLNHPSIVTIFDTGEDQDLAYIAMEFVRGDNLGRHVAKESLLPLPQVIQIVAKTAMALDYAHANEVVHRDIKPANIMFDPESRTVKVTDFGIARLTEGGRTRTKTGMVMGTPYYMSPEQIGGKKVDGRSDLYSLGCTFYQLVTGELPFKGDDMATLLFQITRQPHPDPRTLRPGLPPCLVAVIDKSLAKDPEARHQRGTELAQELVRCVRSLVKKKG